MLEEAVATMKREWFVYKNGKQHGPIPLSKLKDVATQGRITPEDLVWCEGLDDWTPAGRIKDLFRKPAPVPPPLPPPLPAATPPTQAPPENIIEKRAEHSPRPQGLEVDETSTIRRYNWILVGVCFAFLSAITLSRMPRKSNEKESKLEPPPNRPPMLVAPFDEKQAHAAQEAWAESLGIEVEVTNDIGMKFRLIPPGTFDMGSPEIELHRDQGIVGSSREKLHQVTITQPKLLGVYEVTQSEWRQVMVRNPSTFTASETGYSDVSRFPVETVSWQDCQMFLVRLNELHGMPGWRYRLPTEAEWEYACRAGTVTPFWFGNEATWKDGNFEGSYPSEANSGYQSPQTTAVGKYAANPFGLFDVHGNVEEWCHDGIGHWRDPISDPVGPTHDEYRAVRGGYHFSPAEDCRSATRSLQKPAKRSSSTGFRVLCELIDSSVAP